jgi:hypothetical protein
VGRGDRVDHAGRVSILEHPLLAEKAHSPLGGNGVMFLMLFVPVLVGVTAIGVFVGGALTGGRAPLPSTRVG